MNSKLPKLLFLKGKKGIKSGTSGQHEKCIHCEMVFVPRRRSLYFKVLLLIPASWFLLTLFINLNERVKHPNADDLLVLSQLSSSPSISSSAHQVLNNIVLENNVNRVNKLTNSESKLNLVPGESEQLAPGINHKHHKLYNKLNAKRFNQNAVIPMPIDDSKKGPGELGKPVVLPTNVSSEVQSLVSKGWEDNAFNQYISDMISLRRSLPDVRDPQCKNEKYHENLPQTSVIICFHNEAWSVLLRTVHSVLDRSPENLIKEIILVDDFSNREDLMKPLEEYVKPLGKVKIIRAKKREGLIRARLLGANEATAPVLTYLDSHCECTEGWLQPLLDRIARDPNTVVCPVIDVINDKTFEYHYRGDANSINVGGFDWNLQFNWHAIPDREKKRRVHSTDPVRSPTMAGGLFSISKDFFERLGTYDSGFDIWGGENLELSFKTWMCGGVLEIIPCSHVGHIFRSRSPYKWKTGVNVLVRNSIRLAEVWMDDYKKYYYQRIGNNLGDYGDVTDRKKLRDQLNCKSFEWYVKNVYPELFIPGEAVASGEVRNLGGDSPNKMCLDSPARKQDLHKAVGLYPCHNQGGNQVRYIICVMSIILVKLKKLENLSFCQLNTFHYSIYPKNINMIDLLMY
uniref:Polypeptide N-acetylgalactosaminyltransferase n=1 Tax=Tetranychus urticae TaxID=32264 RepID=T1KB10_TETUR